MILEYFAIKNLLEMKENFSTDLDFYKYSPDRIWSSVTLDFEVVLCHLGTQFRLTSQEQEVLVSLNSRNTGKAFYIPSKESSLFRDVATNTIIMISIANNTTPTAILIFLFFLSPMIAYQFSHYLQFY